MESTRSSRKNSNTDPNSPLCSPRKPLVRDSPASPSREIRQRSKKAEKSKQSYSTDIDVDPNLTEDESPTPEEIKAPTSNPSHVVANNPQIKAQKDLSESNRLNSNHFLVALLVVVSCIALLLSMYGYSFYSNAGENKTPAPVDISGQIMELLDNMQDSFPQQKKETWLSFLSALSSVTEEKPSQPAVLLFVGGNTVAARHTMQCVAITLATNTNKLLLTMNSANADSRRVTVEVEEIANLRQHEEAIKNELDAQIHSILNQSFSVVLGPLERIPPQAALLLHGYCDNFMAPFKKRVIILTVTFESDSPLSSTQLDQKLHDLWDSTLGIDKSASIVSRVANNVVFIEPETGSTPCTD